MIVCIITGFAAGNRISAGVDYAASGSASLFSEFYALSNGAPYAVSFAFSSISNNANTAAKSIISDMDSLVWQKDNGLSLSIEKVSLQTSKLSQDIADGMVF